MAYETPITIKEAVESIKRRQYVLPSIQREFVWKTDQIETLFDSLMRDYPIGTFLFWKVDKTRIKDFQFYEFLTKYHEKDLKHNQKVDLTGDEDIIALLDGQQRLTSLYLALVGSYAVKGRYKARNNPSSYPERKLYLNLLKPSENSETEYNFRFLTKENVSSMEDGFHWFECAKILSFKEKDNVNDYIEQHDLDDTSLYEKRQTRFVRKTIERFYDIIHKYGTISYYLEKSEELDKVLQIFIRINSGGTKLSYSDLLLSIATAKWSEKDARDVIHDFVDHINKIGEGFVFNKDLVLKNCLVLANFKDVRFKVDNFNRANMKTIERDWEKSSMSLRVAIELISKFGYTEKSLTSTYAIIPIAYFIFKNECSEQILQSSRRENDRKAIKEWLARVLLKGTFDSQADSIFVHMRQLIDRENGRFPLKETIEFYKGKRKSISFGDDEIDNILQLQYGKPKTYCALTLIYPALNHSLKFQQDHIHPISKFGVRSMKEAGFSDEQIENFSSKANSIVNLQLLEPTINVEKSDKPFREWLYQSYPDASARTQYLRQHHIDPNQSLDLGNFIEFTIARREAIRGLLTSILDADTEDTRNSQHITSTTERVNEENDVICLSDSDWTCLHDALTNPLEPNAAMHNAFKSYRTANE